MNLLNTILVAWRTIRANKTRSLLTMLGVIIGVGSVILLTSIGKGLQVFIEEQFESLGANTVLVYPTQLFGESGMAQGGGSGMVNSKQFTQQNVNDIKRMRDFAQIVLPETENRGKLSYKGETKAVTLMGTTADFMAVRDIEVETGRFFTESEARAGQRVLVLGPNVVENIFGEIDPINKSVRLNEVTYKVVGVTESKGAGLGGGGSFDDLVLIPLEAYFRLFDSNDINVITVQVRDKSQIELAIAEIETYLQDVDGREPEEYDVLDQKQILETVSQILGMVTVGLGGIAAISLVVGGIGIMNIMLVSVTERTREIGLRKALGATPNQILVQFLIESSLLSVIGGGIGVALASLFSFLLRVASDFPSTITFNAIGLAFTVSVAVGIVFGVAPARKASKLSPIEALRSE